jgi:hypothetical protein
MAVLRPLALKGLRFRCSVHYSRPFKCALCFSLCVGSARGESFIHCDFDDLLSFLSHSCYCLTLAVLILCRTFENITRTQSSCPRRVSCRPSDLHQQTTSSLRTRTRSRLAYFSKVTIFTTASVARGHTTPLIILEAGLQPSHEHQRHIRIPPTENKHRDSNTP